MRKGPSTDRTERMRQDYPRQPAAAIIAPHITNVINACITNHIFPESWNSSRISSVPKNDDPIDLEHYGLIFILLLCLRYLKNNYY